MEILMVKSEGTVATVLVCGKDDVAEVAVGKVEGVEREDCAGPGWAKKEEEAEGCC